MVIASVVLAMMAFSFQVLLSSAWSSSFCAHPALCFGHAARMISLSISRGARHRAVRCDVYPVLHADPVALSQVGCPKWPGPAFVTAVVDGLHRRPAAVIGTFGGYGLTYGSLAGVMVALIFFFLIGFGVVIGAELNAALAETPDNRVREAARGTGG
jgi:membrane protein